jgi:hypothetical protein
MDSNNNLELCNSIYNFNKPFSFHIPFIISILKIMNRINTQQTHNKMHLKLFKNLQVFYREDKRINK